MSQNSVPWSFAFGLVVGPIILFFLLVPRAIDIVFPGLSVDAKTILLILSVITLLWSMLQSVKQANYILEWSILIAVLGILLEVERYLPTRHSTSSQVIWAEAGPTPIPTLTPIIVVKVQPQVGIDKKKVEISRDALQFTTFDAKEKTPIPTPTVTPNLTPLFDFSSLTQKDQSIERLPDSAFFGGRGSGDSSFSGISNWVKRTWSYLLGR